LSRKAFQLPAQPPPSTGGRALHQSINEGRRNQYGKINMWIAGAIVDNRTRRRDTIQQYQGISLVNPP
jgi:hypothetical protein